MPKNVVMRPHGIIESVSGPDGREGVVKFGEDIIIRGHDLEVGPYDSVCFDFHNRAGKIMTWVAAIRRLPDLCAGVRRVRVELEVARRYAWRSSF